MTRHAHPYEIEIRATDAQGNTTTAHAEYGPDSPRSNPAAEVLDYAIKSAGNDLLSPVSDGE